MSEYKNKNLWAIIDVSEDARVKAKVLSKQEKKKLGPWLSDFILKQNNNPIIDANMECDHCMNLKKINRQLDEIKMEFKEIYFQIEKLSSKVYEIPKKTILDKFFGRSVVG